MVPYYHPRVFERVNIALLDLFDRVEINRYNADGTIRKKIRVPLTIHYSKNFADFILSTQDHPESKHTTPILGLRMGGLERNASGTTSRVFTREIYDVETKQIIQDMRPCPWIQTYTLTSYTELIQDHFQIMEQIIPYFNPTFNTAIKEFEFSNLKRDVIVELVSVSPQYNDEVDRSKARSYLCDYTFRVKFDMYAPFYLGTLIQQINNRISVSGQPIEIIESVGIDNMTVEEYDRKVNEVVSAGKQLDSIVVSSIKQSTSNDFIKFVDIGADAQIPFVVIPAGKSVSYGSIAVTTAYNNNGANVSIGTIANPNLIMAPSDSNLSLASKFSVELTTPKFAVDTQLYIFYNRSSATEGNFEAEVRWV
jgi:hypothetical protein